MSSLALSVLLSLVSAVAYAAGAIVQERVAAGGDGRSYTTLLRNAAWWAAVALNGVGAVLHVVALAYGPLSLVQPLGALTIVFALPMAALFVRRRAGTTAWRGAVTATVGLAGLLALTGSAQSHTLGASEQAMLAAVTFGGVAALFLLARGLRGPMVRSVLLATGAGIAFGMGSVFTKTVAVEWTSGSVGSGLPTLLVIAGLAAAGLLLSQSAYRGAGLTAPLAVVTVVNPVVAAAVGITLFGEHFRFGLTGTLLALVSGAVTAGGLVLLTRERLGAERTRTAPDAVRTAAPGAADGGAHSVPVPRSPSGRLPELASPPAPSSPVGARPAAAGRPSAEVAATASFPAPNSLPPALTPPQGRRVVGGVAFGGPASGGDRRTGSVQILTPPALR
ncbi:DMT family transporter [Streptomyces fulvorobeus]|uniref:Membrane protein n=1 Tax=Streptomyces fulvorobeus TaxID=284028 RepID=A0A7J0CG08_9ACTN|nr:DMT family transporter [Streptomyces fulvorobeus]NYE44145.1 putative membrane protein [Streptomyces fulvorobeus]GFN00657.1 membrane protein [Streptomyces fulvorobeus]